MALTARLKKSLGGFRLDVELEAENGLVTGLLGASGCGKSLTLRCLAGLERPDSGRIALNGRLLYDSEKGVDLPPQKRRVGYLFQNYSLFPHMTALENIAVCVKTGDRRAAAARLMAALGLSGLEERRPDELSGGQRQRAALARILASAPEALLLDEPFSALDSGLRWRLELELAEMLGSFAGPTIFVSHSRDEVYRLCSRARVLTDGRAEAPREVKDLFNAPETLSASLLTGCRNHSRALRLDGGLVEALDWGVRLAAPAARETTHVGIRAHHIRPAAAAEPNAIFCPVVRVVEDVFETLLLLETPGGRTGDSLLCMALDKTEWSRLGAPAALWARLPEDSLKPLRRAG